MRSEFVRIVYDENGEPVARSIVGFRATAWHLDSTGEKVVDSLVMDESPPVLVPLTADEITEIANEGGR